MHIAELMDGSNSKKMRLACKIFDKEKAPEDFLRKFFPRELEILTKIENPHIIQVRKSCPQFLQFVEEKLKFVNKICKIVF